MRKAEPGSDSPCRQYSFILYFLNKTFRQSFMASLICGIGNCCNHNMRACRTPITKWVSLARILVQLTFSWHWIVVASFWFCFLVGSRLFEIHPLVPYKNAIISHARKYDLGNKYNFIIWILYVDAGNVSNLLPLFNVITLYDLYWFVG